MLTKKQFDVLERLEKIRHGESQRAIAANTKMSLGAVNKVMSELIEAGFVSEGKITDEGILALEPYRVKRAVFFAAGFGSRLVPITLNTPKPLVRVYGKRIIDGLLDAVTAVGITDIYIVRGYLGEQFDQLLYKYPTIKFIDNPVYNESNNISSAMCARHLFAGAYIFESDLLLQNPDLVRKYQYSSNYIGVPVDVTDDWCFIMKDKYISKLCLGGTNCYHMFGISYWNEHDGTLLGDRLEKVYNSPGGKERYWDQVPIDYYIDDFKISVRECTFDDIIEIDSFRELRQLDSTYDIK